MNFAKVRLLNFSGTPTPTRRKRDKRPIKQREDDEILQDYSGNTFYFGAQPSEQRFSDYETEPLETSEPVFLIPPELVPISTIQQKASLQGSSLPDEITDLPHEVSDLGPFSTPSSSHSQNQKSSAVKTEADLHLLEWLRAALDESERKREEERKRHQYREKGLMETVQAMSDVVNEYEKETLKHKNFQQDLETNFAAVLDELEAVQCEKAVYEDETKKLQALLAKADDDKRVLDEQVKLERQQNEQILKEIKRERNLRIKSQIMAEEERKRSQLLDKKMKEELQKERALQKTKREIEAKVGVPVKVRRIGRQGAMTDEDLHKLTPAMITQMKTATEQFAKLFPVTKIEYIMNDYLYKQFDETRAKFKSTGRGTKEVLVFHGTDRKNINSYRIN
jgi:hypothetical protein